MPRTARITAPGLVYHVTHRGNRRGDVFFDREDRETYLRWLAGAGRRHGLDLWAYCLMTNHVHLLARGRHADSLGRAMGELQGRYARRISEARGWSGHLWANRFYSHPVVGDGLWAAVRYIERNPVRAGMVNAAEEYPWSSARAHCGLAPAGILAPERPFPGKVADWKSWLEIDDESSDERLRASALTGRPMADGESFARLERQLGRSLAPRPRGRPRKIRVHEGIDLAEVGEASSRESSRKRGAT